MIKSILQQLAVVVNLLVAKTIEKGLIVITTIRETHPLRSDITESQPFFFLNKKDSKAKCLLKKGLYIINRSESINMFVTFYQQF